MALAAPVYRVDTTEQVVYLTFDDGPYIEVDTHGHTGQDGKPKEPSADATTQSLLDKLDDLRSLTGDVGLSATFFVNGWAFDSKFPDFDPNPADPNAVARRNMAVAILGRGHDIASHAYLHPNPWGKVDRKGAGLPTIRQMIDQIIRCRRALTLIDAADKGGSIQPYFRSPGDPSYWPIGEEKNDPKQNISARRVWQGQNMPLPPRARFRKLLVAAALNKLAYVSYNIWTKDNQLGLPADWVYWHARNAQRSPRLAGSNRADLDRLSFDTLGASRKGGIILMHNGRAASVVALGAFDALDGIIPYIYSQGFVVRKLPSPPLLPGV